MDSKSGYKLVRSVKADTFDFERLDQYTLLLQIGQRDFQAAAFDESKGTLEWLEDFALAEVSGHSAFLDTLKAIRFNSSVLSAGFWKSLVVCFKNTHFIQTPGELFDPETAIDYLRLNSRFSPDIEIPLACTTGNKETVTLFGVPSEIRAWLDSAYAHTSRRFIHQSAALTANALASQSKSANTTMHMVTDRFRMHLIATGKKELLYYNQFAIKDFSDYNRYLSIAFHVLKLDPETCPVILWGFITRQSPQAQELKDLVRILDFGQLNPGSHFGLGISGIQDHQYPDLFAAYSVNKVEL